MSVIVDVDRIGADDALQVAGVDAGKLDLLESERASGLALVLEKLRRVAAAGHEEVGPAIAVAVERRHAAADEELPGAGIDVIDTGIRGLVDVVGHVACRALGGERRAGDATGG